MSFLDTCCCLTSILIGIVFVVFLNRSRKKKAAAQEGQSDEKKSPEEFLLLGRQNLQLGSRQLAVKDFLQAYRHGRPDLREKAIRALEEMGEVETF